MYRVNTNVKAENGIQIVFDDISDFYKFDRSREEKQEEHIIRGYVKSIDVEVLYCDEYNNGMYEWYVVNVKFLNYLEPLRWHQLEDYRQ